MSFVQIIIDFAPREITSLILLSVLSFICWFVITEITASDRPTGDRNLAFEYKIKAKISSEGETMFRPTEYWTETLAKI